ncbi:putative dehydrogenase [Chelatococcus caeni]|uniref:Putative dehydrogenase n=1 Tax=Chelatococcus caeni TaxID=1348468 RepID=A0A840BY68_9HYPH|nr:Gfo/Idh/MocA family oxidoreductase [Chelatococcus caeni]MBB4017503.1 putative dehydrogenase [Chelatococcus caeni]
MTRLRVATIGAGYFSQFHHDAWARMDDVEIVAICDRDIDKAAAFAQRFAIPGVYADAARMLDEVAPDLLDIIAPPASHRELVGLAAERGIPAICQKAFCRSLAEAEETVALAEAAGIPLIVHENFRFEPWHLKIRELIDAGLVGPLYQASFRLRPGDGRGERAYLDRQPYFQTMERFLIHETAIHFIDTFRFLFGEVAGVDARLRRVNPVLRGEDAGIIVFSLANGAAALFDGNRLSDHAADDRRLTMGEMLVEGENGTLRLDGYGRLFFRRFGENAEEEIAYEWERRGFAGDSVYKLQRHVVDHLRHGRPVVNTGRDYLVNLRIEEAIYRSAARDWEPV